MGKRAALALFLAACAAIAGDPAAVSAKVHQSATDVTAEGLLARVLQEISGEQFDRALYDVEALIRIKPNFRLAHLIKGDLLLARVRPLSTMGAAPDAPKAQVAGLRAEAAARLRAYREPPPVDRVPSSLLEMRPDQQYAVVVDTRRSRLYLYHNDKGTPRYVADYYVSSGKNGAAKMREGDEKTPVGVYHVTRSIPREKLSDFYGNGAFPISYPNEWDRREGRDGHGIWLHGTPSDTYSRPPRASNGCVVLANADLDAVAKDLQVGLTPVIISEHVEWLSVAEWERERDAFERQLDQWREDWESLDTDRYLRHYSREFRSNGEDFAAWSRHKRQVNAGKQWIKVETRNVSMFRSPGAEPVVVVTFDQDYRSNNLSNVMKKRQYWIREGSQWRIAYEGAA